MTTPQTERLYNLLPAIYRLRDTEQGEQLRALLAVIEHELGIIEDDIAGLYDNWFIETCAEWVVPYIGELLGIRGISEAGPASVSLRSLVANTIAYRRRKGNAAILEHVARDVTGWYARVVECRELLAAFQHVDHLRPGKGRTIDLRDASAMAQLGSPFETTAHMVDVRPTGSGHGVYNLPNIAIFLWRLQSYPITQGTARKITEGCYTFHPFGIDMPLFNRPQPEADISHVAEAINVPGPIAPHAFATDLQAQQVPDCIYYGSQGSLEIFKANGTPVPPHEIMSSDLSHWNVTYGNAKTVAVDVHLGRILFANTALLLGKVAVTYHYGFSADLGGGSYDRQQTLVTAAADTLIIKVPGDASSLTEALNNWTEGSGCIIQIGDNRSYVEDLEIDLNNCRWLAIQAANGQRPCLIGNLVVTGGETDTTLTLNGLLIHGTITVKSGIELNIAHCTLAPQHGSAIVVNNPAARVSITHSITGPLQLPSDGAGLSIGDSIVDAGLQASGGGNQAIAAPDTSKAGPLATLARTTIFGDVAVSELTASEVIFMSTVTATRRQSGYVRFSYVPPDSATPRHYRCQPDLALAGVTNPVEQARIQTRLRPVFTAQRYGQPGYAQLSQGCAAEIHTGAENGAEMGVFNSLQQAWRESRLQASLDDYLCFGLEAGIVYVT